MIAKCDHCKEPAKELYGWTLQACANKRRRNKFQLCGPCDIDLNRLVLDFFNHKKARSLTEVYAKKSLPSD